ncbi:tyrosine-type recombinase/integrase [Candidatus Cardinium hertigii]|uniref:tyrosine-type recombinase/integrase n=1 Tax=Candidatus Cardinium hertigii TaxID=247481 RepID=UPI003D7E07FB
MDFIRYRVKSIRIVWTYYRANPIGIRQVQKIIKQIANKAKITQEVTPHVLRHTFATLALQKGISLASVQKILGHDRGQL